MVTIGETLDAWVDQGLIDRWAYGRTFDGETPGIMIYGKTNTQVEEYKRKYDKERCPECGN